jgi:DNA-binding GntR family transcriptional regulator
LERDALAQRTSEGIARVLRSEIFSGALKPGEALPERALAERLNVSRTPVREALFVLRAEGLVDLVPNRGAAVRSFTEEDLLEIYRIRGLLESHAAELAAELCTPERLDALEDAQIQLRRMIARGTPGEQAIADLAFHAALYRAAGSPLLQSMLDQVLAFTVSFRSSYPATSDRSQTALVEHAAIFDAIRERDGQLAARLMREHVASSCTYALAVFRAVHSDHSLTGAE